MLRNIARGPTGIPNYKEKNLTFDSSYIKKKKVEVRMNVCKQENNCDQHEITH